ncbi:unnamed protein product [Phytomonas sp. Hart1]|nr:unnamed protein product [Phytomonas sp. Hart1]|eukprot:CCW67335.1 unnamed protein product [Phytomonas sp. isolate Hart1]
MSWCPPGAFIGEFDSFVGPSISFAFEYNTFKEGVGISNKASNITYVSSKVILGEKIASGALHPNYSDYMRSVASRVLTSNEDHKENIIFQDIGCPCISSISFCLPDILARGEKRSFCLVFLHPSYNKMLSKWPLIAVCSRIFIQDYCFEAANELYTLEYSTLPDLEQCREEAHKTSLRPFEALIKRKDEDLWSTFTRIHCFFEIVLPLLFSNNSMFNSLSSQLSEDINKILKDKITSMIEEVIPQAELRYSVVNLQTEKDKCEIEASTHSHLSNQIIVKPLPVWLLEFSEGFSSVQEPQLQLHDLLNALFSGEQIIVFGDNESSCASLALSMSYMLPHELMRTKLYSNSYVMPYESQIVSFSNQFLSEWEVVPFRDSAQTTDRKRLFALSEIEADGVVGVCVCKGRIDQVFYCDDLAHAVATPSPSSSACYNNEVPHPRITTLTCRIMGLLQTYRTDISKYLSSNDSKKIEVEITSIKLLTTQIMQLVSEYALRGSVYLKLFRQQEIMVNEALLKRRASSRDTSLLSKIYKSFKSVLVSNTPLRSGLSLTTDDISHFPVSVLQKNSSLLIGSDKRYSNKQFLFLSSSPEDHRVLIFLGSRATA